MSENSMERAYLGVKYVTITADVSKEHNLPVRKGAYITDDSGASGKAVVKGGPADKAGIRDGDIVLRVNDIEVGARGSILSLVGEYMVGETVRMSILRNGAEIDIDVVLGAYPED